MNEKELVRRIENCVEQYSDEIIDLARNLIRIPSENIAPNGYEKDAQEYLLEWLKGVRNVEVDTFTPPEVEGIENHPAYFKGRKYAERPNVVAYRRGKGKGRSLILSSHIDTVTRNPLPWGTGNPFSGEIVDGKLYGRGSFDMKGALASTFVLLKILSDKKIHSKGDVIVESVVDEENGGSNGTLACRLKGYTGDAAILPEPSLLSICPACKGGKAYRIYIEGHAGTGYGGEEILNPTYGLGALLRSMHEYERGINKNPQSQGAFYNYEKNPRTVILDKVQAGDLEPGGNIGVPDSAWFSVFINTLPGYSEEDLDTELRKHLLENASKNRDLFKQDLKITGLTRYLYPFETEPSHPIIPIMEKGFTSFSKRDAVVEGAKFGCDGFIFHKFFRIPTIIFGPRGGNAHARDEYVLLDDLILLTKVFFYLVIKWCDGYIEPS